MSRFGYVLLSLVLLACNNEKKKEKVEDDTTTFTGFSGMFQEAKLPYQLTDTGLLKPTDTSVARPVQFDTFIPDSIKSTLSTKSGRIRYIPLAKLSVPHAETYFIVKAVGNKKKAGLLLSFDKNGEVGAVFPFLVPDDDPTTTQTSVIDKSYTISKNVSQLKEAVASEGREVFAYSNVTRKFNLIMTDPLDKSGIALVNPIDTLKQTAKYSGDYVKDKHNIISIRDGRSEAQRMAFIHIEKEEGECTGELKGEILFTSSTTAVFRQGGDPCVLQFTFTSSSVSIKEEQGCGNHRGLNCPLEGSFPKKKTSKSKTPVKDKKK